ncbi:uncharacterized protein LOC106028097 [Cavia porcellus]|uniref:uncharacterized protein LOC106028097 n=1 Tax=Cavia porcellus TaxID=10141 RepID=UPI002FDFD798
MGNVNCGPLALSLRMLLGARGIRMEKQMVLQFFKCINDLAPWFLPTGSLTLPSWEKLERDIQFAEEQGMGVDPMVRPIWEMVRACLRTESMVGAAQGLKEARHAFEQACSESSREASEVGSPSHSDSEGEDPKVGPKEETDSKIGPHRNTGQKVHKPAGALCEGMMESLGEELERVESDLQEMRTPGEAGLVPSAPPWEPPQGMSAPGGWGPPPPFPATLPSSGRRSVFDKEGNSLTGRKDSQPKNGQRGPSYKAGPLSPSSPFPGVNSQSGLPQGQQEWTFVLPPDSY